VAAQDDHGPPGRLHAPVAEGPAYRLHDLVPADRAPGAAEAIGVPGSRGSPKESSLASLSCSATPACWRASNAPGASQRARGRFEPCGKAAARAAAASTASAQRAIWAAFPAAAASPEAVVGLLHPAPQAGDLRRVPTQWGQVFSVSLSVGGRASRITSLKACGNVWQAATRVSAPGPLRAPPLREGLHLADVRRLKVFITRVYHGRWAALRPYLPGAQMSGRVQTMRSGVARQGRLPLATGPAGAVPPSSARPADAERYRCSAEAKLQLPVCSRITGSGTTPCCVRRSRRTGRRRTPGRPHVRDGYRNGPGQAHLPHHSLDLKEVAGEMEPSM